MITNTAIEVIKWIKGNSWKESVVLLSKNIKITRNRIFKILLTMIVLASLTYVYFVNSTVSLAYQYSYNAKIKSQLISSNYINESEYYADKLKDVPEEFSKNFVKPKKEDYYQVPKNVFALK